MPHGAVLSLHRWPVKSFAGETLDALDLDERGVPGDRAHALWVKGAKRATARVVPDMLRWAARYDAPVDGTVPLPTLTAPDGTTHAWDEPDLAARLSADVGRELALARDERGQQDVPNTILVTLESTRAGLERELGIPIDLRRFRPNVHLDVDAEAFAETGWEGRTMHIGEAELTLGEPCPRCSIVTRDPDTAAQTSAVLDRLVEAHDTLFGIAARPVRPATIRVGDAVEV